LAAVETKHYENLNGKLAKLEDHTLVKFRWDIRVHGWQIKTNDPVKEEARLKDIRDYGAEHKEEYAIAVKSLLKLSYQDPAAIVRTLID
jgi:hypothetical protein